MHWPTITPRRSVCLRAAALAALAAAGSGRVAHAQQHGWHSVVEANANLVFGATSRTLTSLAGSLSHASGSFTADG
jgi:hypothetical protein